MYKFSGLGDGDFYVSVNPATLPAGYTPTGEGDPGTSCVGFCDNELAATVTGGGSVTDVDFGYHLR